MTGRCSWRAAQGEAKRAEAPSRNGTGWQAPSGVIVEVVNHRHEIVLKLEDSEKALSVMVLIQKKGWLLYILLISHVSDWNGKRAGS